jgi:hypothetical protein
MSHVMPLSWARRNEAAPAEDRRRGRERSMSERLEEAVRLSRSASELEANLGCDAPTLFDVSRITRLPA